MQKYQFITLSQPNQQINLQVIKGIENIIGYLLSDL